MPPVEDDKSQFRIFVTVAKTINKYDVRIKDTLREFDSHCFVFEIDVKTRSMQTEDPSHLDRIDSPDETDACLFL